MYNYRGRQEVRGGKRRDRDYDSDDGFGFDNGDDSGKEYHHDEYLIVVDNGFDDDGV